MIVIGGGISGLAAAWELRGKAEVTVLEAGDRVGGKLRTGSLAGTPVDEGAESVMALRPEAVRLAEEVGLGDSLCDPAPAPVTFWTRDALRPLPAGHVMGIPADPAALNGTGLLSAEGLARLAQEEAIPASPALTDGGDISIAGYLVPRIGQEAVDRLVEPLLGGIYAGRTDQLSLRSAMPFLAPVAASGDSLLATLRRRRDSQGAASSQGPRPSVVRGIVGGTGRLPRAVAAASGARVLTHSTALALERTPGNCTPGNRWRVHAATGHGPATLDADALIVALPAPAAATLLGPHSPAARAELDTVRYAGSAVLTMAFTRTRPGPAPDLNGFLVPPVDGRTIKAATVLSHKWAWQRDEAPSRLILRASVGRVGEEHLLDLDDRHLTALATAELTAAIGPLGSLLASKVTRWPQGLPQYEVGHADRVAAVREAIGKLPGVELCGALYEGVGVAACVATGRAAAERVLANG
ncbi:protoporphyrinogen oxidase [Streptomyces durmitorensis]|uniref:Coproporphyrinogen III oxidase n=1 Tax=Streptomyces durmitorensis TaxID=319947 RepID=A0ABY4Q856_9ACTN|nr:protoporphyrinogen oxidase [Streptomyces durmitorensis]UQT61549.1 protoporphyrinogen oxidase [Streptomyces durmitorensis]